MASKYYLVASNFYFVTSIYFLMDSIYHLMAMKYLVYLIIILILSSGLKCCLGSSIYYNMDLIYELVAMPPCHLGGAMSNSRYTYTHIHAG